jgi:phage-related protein
MNFQILFFATSVQTLIEKWPVGIYASFVRITEQMVLSGPNLGMPYTKAMGEGLFEIRARGSEGIGRAFFLLHERQAHRHLAWLCEKDPSHASQRTSTGQTTNERCVE